MIAYCGLLLYVFETVMRLADWWGPLVGLPVDYIIYSIIFIGIAIGPQRERIWPVLTSQTTFWVLLYSFLVPLSVTITGDFYIAFEQGMRQLNQLLAYLAFAIVLDSWTKIKWALFLFVPMAAYVGYNGIVLSQTGTGLAGQGLYWAGRVRWVGMYDGANVMSMLLAICAGISLAFILRPRSVGLRIVAILCLGLIGAGLFLANSRGGVLATLVVAGLTVLMRGSEKMRKIPKVRVVPAAILLVLLLGVAPSRMGSMNDSDHSAAGRIDAWQVGIDMLKERPVLGVGAGKWRHYHFRLAHNAYVQTMGEVGVLGLFAWLAMLRAFVAPLPALALRIEDPEPRMLARATLFAFTGYLAASFFITTTQFDLPYIFGGTSLAMCHLTNLNPRANRRTLFILWCSECALIVTVYLTTKIFYA